MSNSILVNQCHILFSTLSADLFRSNPKIHVVKQQNAMDLI